MTADLAHWDALEAAPASKPRRIGKARKDAPSERVVQRAIIKALRALGLRVVHIPNGGRYEGDSNARLRMAMAKRADGEVAGFPDLLIMKPQGQRVGFLEIKREGGIVSDGQERCLAHLAADGFPVAVVCTLDEALAAVKGWGW